MRSHIRAFALAFGLLWGAGIFLLTWWMIALDGASGEATFIGRLYRGYSISPVGSIIRLSWGLADGAIGGAVFAWLYNSFVAVFEKDGQPSCG